MGIETFYLVSPTSETDMEVQKSPFLNPIEYDISDCTFHNLKKAVSWAIDNDIDAILVIETTFKPSRYHFEGMFDVVMELYNHEIYAFGLLDEKIRKNYFPIRDGVCAVSQWENESAWIILKPLFPIIFSLKNELFEELYHTPATARNVLNILGHTKFTFTRIKPRLSKERRINIIIPFRNIARYIEDCFKSISMQKYRNYRVFFIDDCSEDEGLSLIPDNPRFFKTRTTSRKYALENIVNTLTNHRFGDQDIICLLDGDDQLSHPYVLRLVNEFYSCSAIGITYGSYRIMGTFSYYGYAYRREEFARLRKVPWKASHLKTFKYSLFLKYKKIDPALWNLKDSKGEFFKMPYDMAIMYPLLEIAGYSSSKFIDLPLYLYRLHSDNDHIQNREEQKNGEIEIRGRNIHKY